MILTTAQTATPGSRSSSGEVRSGAPVGEDQGQTVEVTGPDGVKRRVRIIGPTL